MHHIVDLATKAEAVKAQPQNVWVELSREHFSSKFLSVGPNFRPAQEISCSVRYR